MGNVRKRGAGSAERGADGVGISRGACRHPQGFRLKAFGSFIRSALRASNSALIVAICLALSGCGGTDFEVAPISGLVTLDGAPLAGAQVGFEPRRSGKALDAGPGSYARTDTSGRFVLETLDGYPGAVVGMHDVWIRTYRAPADRSIADVPETIAEKVPARYNELSTLTFDVTPEGSGAADFALTSEPDPPQE